jgi:predicted metalloprotease
MRPDDFDFPNSPAAVGRADLSGRTLMQRTSARIQGVVRATSASRLWAASLACASATALAVDAAGLGDPAYVITGCLADRPDDSGGDDRLTADHIERVRLGEAVDPAVTSRALLATREARRTLMLGSEHCDPTDIELAARVDAFDFAMEVVRDERGLRLEPHRAEHGRDRGGDSDHEIAHGRGEARSTSRRAWRSAGRSAPSIVPQMISRPSGSAKRARQRRRVAALVVGSLLVLLAACTSDEPGTESSAPAIEDPQPATRPPSAVSGADDAPVVGIATIVADLNGYWTVASAELGFDYEPVPIDRVTTGTDGAVCSGVAFDLEELAENAFVDPSCDEGITVAYDPAYLDASLARAEATMAHEWGHVVQAQAERIDISLDENGLPIDAELQADCFAGAWAADGARSEIEALRDDTAEAGDPDDVEVDDPDAHGFPEERVIAFDLGLGGGPVACVEELLDALP